MIDDPKKDATETKPAAEPKEKPRPVINITDEEWFDPANKGCCA